MLGGDFNVDFCRNWTLTTLFSSFCDDTGLMLVTLHSECTKDYCYNFSKNYSFSLVDHFILSGMLFDKCVSSTSALHDVDNLSNHDTIFNVSILICSFCPYVIVFCSTYFSSQGIRK
jgi:hypothetical protein